jgi:pyruvate dehydrogenase E1 component alpha subunit
VAVCFFGEGAVPQGTFHESLNMAALWQLPIIYICENNGYAMSTKASECLAGDGIAGKGVNYGIPGVKADGNDLASVLAIMDEHLPRVRSGEGPLLLEFETYRFSGHSRGDKKVYRTRKEEEDWWEHEPIGRFGRWLYEKEMLTPATEGDIRERVETQVRDAVEFAKNSPFPTVETLQEGVFA